jgi:hypothetical protein
MSKPYPDPFLEPEEDIDQVCLFCEFPCASKYCSKECKKAYEEEN